MSVPYSASELAEIARTGNGQDVLDAIEAMNETHGHGTTALMMHSAAEAIVRDRFIAIGDWETPRPAMHWSPTADNEGRATP